MTDSVAKMVFLLSRDFDESRLFIAHADLLLKMEWLKSIPDDIK